MEATAFDTHPLRVTEVARLLGVSASTVRRWEVDGWLTAFYTPGGHRRYHRGDVLRFKEWLQSNRV